MAQSKLEFGPGTKLFKYWTAGEGAAKWMSNPHPWTALRDALIKAGVPAHEADGLATNLMLATPAGRVLFRMHHGKHQGGPSAGEQIAGRMRGGK